MQPLFLNGTRESHYVVPAQSSVSMTAWLQDRVTKGGHVIAQTANFRRHRPQTVGVGFTAGVGLASKRPDLLVESPRSNLHEPVRFHGDTNLRKTTEGATPVPRLGVVSFLSKLES